MLTCCSARSNSGLDILWQACWIKEDPIAEKAVHGAGSSYQTTEDHVEVLRLPPATMTPGRLNRIRYELIRDSSPEGVKQCLLQHPTGRQSRLLNCGLLIVAPNMNSSSLKDNTYATWERAQLYIFNVIHDT